MDRPNTPSGAPTPQKVAKNDKNLTKLLNQTSDDREHEGNEDSDLSSMINGHFNGGPLTEDLVSAINTQFTENRKAIIQTDGTWDDDSRDSEITDLIGRESCDSSKMSPIGQEAEQYELYSLDGTCDLKDESEDEEPMPAHIRNKSRVGTPSNTKRPLSESSPSNRNGDLNMSAKKTRPSSSPSASANLFPKVYNQTRGQPNNISSPGNNAAEVPLLDITNSDDEQDENSSMDEKDVTYHTNRPGQFQGVPRRVKKPSKEINRHGYRYKEEDSSDDETTWRKVNREGPVYGKKPHQPIVTCPDEDAFLAADYLKHRGHGANAEADIKREEHLNVPVHFVRGSAKLPTRTVKRKATQCSQTVSYSY